MATGHGFSENKDLYSLESIESRLTALENTQVSVANMYPVGSIYLTTNSTNPGELSGFSGTTWVAWGSGRVPVCVGSDSDFGSAEKTGGSKTHTITVGEMPKHSHTYNMSHIHEIEGFHVDTSNSAMGTLQWQQDGNLVIYQKKKGQTDVFHGWQSGTYNGGKNGELAYIEDTHPVIFQGSSWTKVPSGSVSKSTDQTGTGKSYNNMPPYITCYMWKRIG